jgi:hypothetical protein
MWVGVDVRRPTRPKQLIGAKKVMFWACFALMGIVDIMINESDSDRGAPAIEPYESSSDND